MPIMKNKMRHILYTLPVLFLAGCGDGWEMRPYDKTPYGDRTAGHGVEYVLAKMMPQKGPVLGAEMEENVPIIKTDEIDNEQPPADAEVVAPAAATPAVVQDADRMFEQKQRK